MTHEMSFQRVLEQTQYYRSCNDENTSDINGRLNMAGWVQKYVFFIIANDILIINAAAQKY